MDEVALSNRGRLIAGLLGLSAAVAVWFAARSGELPPPAQNLAAMTVLMAVFWASQPIPIAVTSLLPIALYPILGIAGSREVCAAYGDRNVFLYLGGFIIAIGLERWDLHRRIALHTVRIIGHSPARLIYGFAFATAFLSMWISNTATTLLMLPIALSLIQTLEEELPRLAENETEQSIHLALAPFSVALLLAIAFGATCGGLSTIVGTPTNTSFRGFWQREFVAHGAPPLATGDWMMAFVPLTVVMLVGMCLLTTRRLSILPGMERLGREFCDSRLRALGPMKSGERRMLAIFAGTAILWITRERLSFGEHFGIPGWGDALAGWMVRSFQLTEKSAAAMVDDSTVALVMAILMFLVTGRRSVETPSEPLIDWQTVERRVPWGVLLLFGGGFAMADAFRTTGLAEWLGTRMSTLFEGAPLWVIIAGTCTLVTVLSEFTSNVATVNTVLPVLAPLAVSLNVEPQQLLIPAAISASFGFMLPVATPPNAIVFGTGRIPVRAMMRYGVLLDILGIVLMTIFALTVVPAVFPPVTGGR
jgi:sodium-dependent dicarboxylate transporter 2/3/5